MMYVVLGYLFTDTAGSPRWHSYYDSSSRATGRYWAQQLVGRIWAQIYGLKVICPTEEHSKEEEPAARKTT